MLKVAILFCSFFWLTGFIAQDLGGDYLTQKEEAFNKGDYQKVIAFDSTQQFDSLYTCKIHLLRGNAFYELGEYTASIEALNDAVRYAPNSRAGEEEKAWAIYNRSFSEYYLGAFKKSYYSSILAEVLLSDVKQPIPNRYFKVLLGAAFSLREYGYLDDASLYLEKARMFVLDSSISQQNSYWKEQQTNHLMLLHYEQILLQYYNDQPEKLLAHLDTLTQLVNSTRLNYQNNVNLSYAYSFGADYFLREKQNNAVNLQLVNQLIDRSEFYLPQGTKYYDYRQSIQRTKLEYYLASNQHEQALELGEKLLAVTDKGSIQRPFFTFSMAKTLWKNGQYKKGFELFKTFAAEVHQGKDTLQSNFNNFVPGSDVTLSDHLGTIAEYLQHHQDKAYRQFAPQFYQIALSQYQKGQLNSPLSNRLFKLFDQIRHRLLHADLPVRLQISTFEQLETIEGQLMYKAFQKNRKRAVLHPEKSGYAEERELREKLTKAIQQNDRAKASKLRKELIVLNWQHSEADTTPHFAFKLKELQTQLDDSTLVLKYVLSQSELYVIRITNQNIIFSPIEQAAELEAKVNRYTNVIHRITEDKDLASELAKKLLPFQWEEYKKIIIQKEGFLHPLPFEALADKNKNYLVNHASISYVPNLIFYDASPPANGSGAFQIYSPNQFSANNLVDLNGALHESEQLSEKYITSTYLFEEANSQRFISASSAAQILHLATHVEFDSTLSLNDSKIHFHDGTVSLEEIYGLKLKADMVVLSACNTGKNIDRTKSLNHAFFHAGVPATVSALWDLPDQPTVDIMLDFYHYLKTGNSKSKALQKAKKEHLRKYVNTPLSAPFFWAGLTQYGSTDPIALKERTGTNYTIWSVIGLLLLFSTGYVLLKSRKGKQNVS